ncbi:MAG: O-antigen ligase family protein [Anaerolineae bacterium]|nr:O-antigen ligase family protein [Anaerolineae bacterium]
MVRRSGWLRLIDWLWLVGLLALPCLIDPLRLEAYESPRATLAIVLSLGIGLAALAVIRCRFRLPRDPLPIAILIWTVSISLSAVLSLSPSRSIFGDLQRRMGMLTQLSLLAAFIGGMMLTRRQRGQIPLLVAAVALIVAGYGILQGVDRPSSTFGVATFAASWSVIVILGISTTVLARGRPFNAVLLLSAVALLIFLILTQTRGAVVGLIGGSLTLGLAWEIAQGRRWLSALIIGGAAVVIVFSIAAYLRIIAIDRSVPLLGRLDVAGDVSGKFRLLMWQDVGLVVSRWPVMVSGEGKPDALDTFRAVIGYGPEMLADVMRPRLSAELRATFPAYQFVDRAHNLWLDTLLTQGWLGLLSLIGVYLAAIGTCIAILRQQGRAWGERGWIAAGALAITVAHGVDQQFSFPSVSADWPWWAVLGMLYAQRQARPTARPPAVVMPTPRQMLMLPLVSGLLAWPVQISLAPRLSASALITIGLLTLVTFITTRHRRITLLSAFAAALAILILNSVNGALQSFLISPERIAPHSVLLAYHIGILAGMGLVIGVGGRWVRRRRYSPIGLVAALVILTASLWWALDATADSVFLIASQQPDPVRANLYLSALTFKTPDDRLTRLTAQTVQAALPAAPDDQREGRVRTLQDLERCAAALNPYAADPGG